MCLLYNKLIELITNLRLKLILVMPYNIYYLYIVIPPFLLRTFNWVSNSSLFNDFCQKTFILFEKIRNLVIIFLLKKCFGQFQFTFSLYFLKLDVSFLYFFQKLCFPPFFNDFRKSCVFCIFLDILLFFNIPFFNDFRNVNR